MIKVRARHLAYLLQIFCVLALCSPAWGSAPYYVAKGTASTVTTASSIPSYPAGVQNGDIVFLSCISHQPVSIGVINTPTDFTSISQNTYKNNSAVNQGRSALFYRRATGSLSGTITVTRTGDTGNDTAFMCQMYLYRGAVGTGTPYDEAVAKYDGDGSTTATWSATTVSSTERTLVAIIAQADNTDALGTPTGYTERAEDFSGTGTDAGIEVYDYPNQSSDGSVTTTTAQTEGWATYHISLKPGSPPDYFESFDTHAGTSGYDITSPAWTEAGAVTPTQDAPTGATEIIGDVIGDDDGSCEADEKCYEWMQCTGVTGTAICTDKLNHGSVAAISYQCNTIYVDTLTGLAAGSYRRLHQGFNGDGANLAYFVSSQSDAGTYKFHFVYYGNCPGGQPCAANHACAGGYCYVDSEYQYVDDKVYKSCVKYDYTNSAVEWKLYDAYDTLLTSGAVTGISSMRTGVQSWILGIDPGNNLDTSTVRFDNFTVDIGDYDLKAYHFGTCGTESCADITTDNCSSPSPDTCTCPSGSTYQDEVLTRSDGTGYSSCGVTAETETTWPDGTYLQLYNDYALEKTDKFATVNADIETLVDYIQGLPVSRMAYIYNGCEINAPENSGDSVGDDDGSCEANEKCGYPYTYDKMFTTDGTAGGPVLGGSAATTTEAVQVINSIKNGDDDVKDSVYGTTTGQVSINESSSNVWAAQKFTAGSSYTLNTAILSMDTVGSPTCQARVHIYSHDAGNDMPEASLGSSLWNNCADMPADEGEVTFKFVTGVSITSSTVYWIVVEASGTPDAANYIQWHYEATDGTFELDENGAGDDWDNKTTTVTLKFKTLITDTDNILCSLILPPTFNKARTEKYPVLGVIAATGGTINQMLYDTDTVGTATWTNVVRLVAQSVDGGTNTGIVGLICHVGEWSQAMHSEFADGFADVIDYLETYFNIDKDKIALYGGSRGGGAALFLTAVGDPGQALGDKDFTVVGAFAGAPPTAIGDHSRAENSVWPLMQAQYPYLLGWATYPDDTLADSTYLYESAVPPHCSSTSCDVTPANYTAPIAKTLVNSTTIAGANSASPIGYCTASPGSNCTTYYGADTKYIVLSFGTHDGIIPLHQLINFDEHMRDAGVDHMTCMYFRGGHGGEYTTCIDNELEYFVDNYLACANNASPCSMPTKPNQRVFWQTDPDTHLAANTICYGCESTCPTWCSPVASSAVTIPFMAIVPVELDSSVSTANGSPYGGSQEPAQILVAGQEGATWTVQILEDDHSTVIDTWSGVFGSVNTDCTWHGDSTTDEWCLITGIDYSCESPTCTRYYNFIYNGSELNDRQTPWYGQKDAGEGDYAYSCVRSTQQTSTHMWQELSDDDYCSAVPTGATVYKLCTGLCQNPSCGDKICQSAWEDINTCVEDCTPGYGHGLFRGIMRGVR